jgi:ABC-type phosphate transport system substrate-binding protein
MVACLLALSLVVFAACGGDGNQGGDQGGGQAASSLNGAGATFPAPIYQQMFQ